MPAARVRLNIGGQVFETTQETLNRLEGTMLKSLCEEKWSDSKSEEIFIDRDPTHFRLILNFLRDGTSTLPASEKDIAEIEREADFYGVSELAVACKTQLEELNVGDDVKWRPDAVEHYWRSFVRFWVDESLVIPFAYDRNGHILAKCIACDEIQDPKCSYTYDMPEDVWKAMAHHMLHMCGTVTQVIGDNCCMVQWSNGRLIHLPQSALLKLP